MNYEKKNTFKSTCTIHTWSCASIKWSPLLRTMNFRIKPAHSSYFWVQLQRGLKLVKNYHINCWEKVVALGPHYVLIWKGLCRLYWQLFRILYSEYKASCRIKEFCIFIRSHSFFHQNFWLPTESIRSNRGKVACSKDKNQNFYWLFWVLSETYHFDHSLMHSQHQSQNNTSIFHPSVQSKLYFSTRPQTIFSKIILKLLQSKRKIHQKTQYWHFRSDLSPYKTIQEDWTSSWSWKCFRWLRLILHSYRFEFCSFEWTCCCPCGWSTKP